MGRRPVMAGGPAAAQTSAWSSRRDHTETTGWPSPVPSCARSTQSRGGRRRAASAGVGRVRERREPSELLRGADLGMTPSLLGRYRISYSCATIYRSLEQLHQWQHRGFRESLPRAAVPLEISSEPPGPARRPRPRGARPAPPWTARRRRTQAPRRAANRRRDPDPNRPLPPPPRSPAGAEEIASSGPPVRRTRGSARWVPWECGCQPSGVAWLALREVSFTANPSRWFS